MLHLILVDVRLNTLISFMDKDQYFLNSTFDSTSPWHYKLKSQNCFIMFEGYQIHSCTEIWVILSLILYLHGIILVKGFLYRYPSLETVSKYDNLLVAEINSKYQSCSKTSKSFYYSFLFNINIYNSPNYMPNSD